MTIYIAAPYPLRNHAVEVMHHLERLGHHVTSRWLTTLDEEGNAGALMDLYDVALADVFLAINPTEWRQQGGGGRHVELGYALALGKEVVLWGVRSNIFHHLSSIRVIERLEDL